MPGGFVKTGPGLLEISSHTKKWRGDTIVAQGKLKIDGDFSLNDGERLGLAIFNTNENETLADDSSGKLEVTGTADISKGSLFVYAEEAINKTAKDTVWKDAVTAGNLVGKFQKVEDNSPLVTFYADYSDPNKVHITLTEPESEQSPAPDTPKPDTPKPDTPKPDTPKPDAPKPDAPKPDAPKPDAPKPDAPKPDAPKPDAPKPDAPKPDAPKPDAPKPDTPKPDAPKPDAPKPDAPKPDAPKPDAPKPDAPKPDAPKPDAPNNDITFVEASQLINNHPALNLAGVLDETIANKVAGNKNALADALITNTQNFSRIQVGKAAEQLQPLFMGGANRLITDSNYAATDAISEHSQTTPERNLWAKAIGSDMTHDADGYVTGYNSENYGAIVGLDLPINPDLNLGLAVSYIESDADTDGHALNHELEAKNWQILGYGNYAAGEATSFNFHAGAGQSSVKGERHIQLKSNLTAKSDYDVDTLQAGFGVSHQLGSDTRNVSPFASFNYARAKSDGYSETGAGAYNLTVDENTYESMRWTAGLRFNQALTPTVSLTGQLAGAIENGDSYSDITASFTDVGSNKFYTQGQESKEAIGIAGIGLAFKPTANTTISANYRGEWRDNYNDQGAAIVFETKF